jgi:sec-independent protein translocase protein TatA
MPGNEWVWVILAIALIFGASRLPLLGKNLGQGIKEFRKGVGEGRNKRDDDRNADGTDPGTGPEPRRDTERHD